MSAIYLTKSKILSGIQCPKRLFLDVYRPELARRGYEQAMKTAMGNQVGEAARGLFPGGALIGSNDDISLALIATRQHLMQPEPPPLFEATFEHEGVIVRADILMKGKEGFRLVEVKSSTSMKDYYILDCAVQSWVIEGSGFPLESIELAWVNKEFIYQGNGDYQDLFLYEDFTEAVIPVMGRIPRWIEKFRAILKGDMPQVEMGAQCHIPYACPFQAHCLPEQPEYPVTIIPRGGRVIWELLAEGIRDIRDIPEGTLVKPIHERIRRVTVMGKPELDLAAGEYLRDLPYPRFYLDFETIGFAVPRWAGTHPFQQSPFQWSCHREDSPDQVTHTEFLDISGNSPMRPFARELLNALADSGPVFVYNQEFEKRILEELSLMLPELFPEIQKLKERLVDLLPLTRRYYYHPRMKGSWSIKSVLPTVAPDLDYKNLEEVQEGMTAQLAYLEAIDPATSEQRRCKLATRMLEYCRMDTLALVRLARFFQEGHI